MTTQINGIQQSACLSRSSPNQP